MNRFIITIFYTLMILVAICQPGTTSSQQEVKQENSKIMYMQVDPYMKTDPGGG
ncbi:hypothetical protein [Bacillus cereus group sp. N21]|uniref:hypothetical protein n=1 Tax=Bacillus cereus group sp. N21 TaxID=2794591 RepID=UPI0018F51511|nr:hypothetical protein [Bacillus cereus group sp. N21]MBJ8030727.1 hypothetical protein [Bacillus cereus group sp. N21]